MERRTVRPPLRPQEAAQGGMAALHPGDFPAEQPRQRPQYRNPLGEQELGGVELLQEALAPSILDATGLRQDQLCDVLAGAEEHQPKSEGVSPPIVEGGMGQGADACSEHGERHAGRLPSLLRPAHPAPLLR
eukprot:8076221-Prorocentrum_lima.AAC.1